MAKFLADASLFIERHNKHFKPDEDDDVWMPAVVANGWSVITADKRKTRDCLEIQERAER